MKLQASAVTGQAVPRQGQALKATIDVCVTVGVQGLDERCPAPDVDEEIPWIEEKHRSNIVGNWRVE